MQFVSVESSLTVLEGEANNLETTLVIFLHESPAVSSVYQSLGSVYQRSLLCLLKHFFLFLKVCLSKLICANIEYLYHQMKDCSNLRTLEEEEEDIFIL